MILNSTQEQALIIGGESTQFGLNLKDPSVFVNMLLKLYGSPVSAVIKEYLSNSFDSHIESGSDKPIVVGLTKDKFFVRDFGKGMSPEFMQSSTQGYCTIGWSTKGATNTQIGGWGWGRLSALAYTNQYWVKTVWQGFAYEYLIFLDGNTIKQTPLNSVETEEPNGTTVTVQLKKEWREFDKWKEAIYQQCAYFEGTVIDIEGDRHTVVVGKEGFIRKSSLYQHKSHLVLGSVYYEIDWNHFKNWNVINNLNLGIYIGLDEGVIPTPSRESIVIDKHSIEVIESKFKTILEQIWVQCEKELTKVQTKSNIEKLKFIYEGKLSLCNMYQYKNICTALGKNPIEIVVDDRIIGNERSLFNGLRDSFKGTGVYCQNWTSLKREYVQSLGYSCAERTKVKLDLYWTITAPIDRRALADQLKEQYLSEWIDFHYTRFDEASFQEWKKNRKSEKKVSKGVVYYRAHVNNPQQCTQDKEDIDLSNYRYVFKAWEATAKKYWTFLNQTFKNFIITKDYGMDLNNLEPSPLLKRMCSEALKVKVYNILGNRTNDKKVGAIIKELNPLLAQYMEEVPLKEGTYDEGQMALVETGEKFGCFDKDEVKLRYMEHHLKFLEFCKYVGFKEYSWSDLKLGENETRLIKRHYILERLAEKKWKEEKTIDTNQLEIQFN